MTTHDDAYPSRRESRPQRVDRDDPVVHAGAGVSPPVAPEHLRGYERDGFMIRDDLFTAGEIALLEAELARLRARSAPGDGDDLIREPGSNEVRSIFRVHAVSELFSRLARDERLVRIAEYVLGDSVYVHQSRLNYKPGLFGKEFYWHSDFETWHVEDGMPRMRALSVSISLSDNTDVNGPLMLIPGSHRQYIACVGETPDDHFRQSLRRQEYGVPDPESLGLLVARGGIRTATGPAGTTVFFDCNTMHGSNGNISPFPRSNVFIVYNAVSNRLVAPFGPARPRPGFLAERDDTTPIRAVGGLLTDERSAA